MFLDPVDLNEYPGYINAIGGPQNAMDLATMSRKVDDRQYKNIDDFHVSFALSL